MRRFVLAALLALWPALGQAQFAQIGPTPPVADNGDRLATTAWVNLFAAGSIPLQSGKIFIGSGGNLAVGQTPSGDCTLSLTGVVTCTQAAGNFNVIGNLIVGGSIIDGNGILFTNIVAPASPAAGTTRGYVDSTNKVFCSKNDAGTVACTVSPSVAVANQFMTGITAAGAITRAQPAFTDISGSAACAQLPSLTGNVTSAACATTIGANQVARAMEAQGVARSVIGVTGNATANVADIQGAANQFLGVNSAGTALAFTTMSQDCTLATGVITCTKTNNVAFTGAATATFGQGSWTPTLNFGGVTTGITYGTQTGRYTQFGNMVCVSGYIALTNKGAAAGNATITGAPFTASGLHFFTIASTTGLTYTGPMLNAFLNGGTAFSIQQASTTGVGAALANTAFANTTDLALNGCYFTS